MEFVFWGGGAESPALCGREASWWLSPAPPTEPQEQAQDEFESYLIGSGDSLDLELAFTGLESV